MVAKLDAILADIKAHKLKAVDAHDYYRYVVPVGPGLTVRVNREAGVNPALPRSGIWKRKSSHALCSMLVKRRQVGEAIKLHVLSPKTCRPPHKNAQA